MAEQQMTATTPSTTVGVHRAGDQQLKEEQKQQQDDDANLCSVCHGEIRDGVRTMCGHVFCQQCLVSWVHRHNADTSTCPLCRAHLQGPAAAVGVTPTVRTRNAVYSRAIDGAGGVVLSTTSVMSREQERDDDRRLCQGIMRRFLERQGRPRVYHVDEAYTSTQ